MRPEPLSDLGGVIIVSNMQMATQGDAAKRSNSDSMMELFL